MNEAKKDFRALLALLALLAATVALSAIPMGGMGPAAALGIAGVKAAIIAMVFMELPGRSGTVRLFAGAGLLWLGLLLVLTLTDFLTRG